MAHRLKTTAGKTLYKLRKQTVEPVFGIIKDVMGFRRFSLRGLAPRFSVNDLKGRLITLQERRQLGCGFEFAED
jgi:hypothetical protein